MATITYERIANLTIGGAGNGNTYRYRVTNGSRVTLSTCERDVAYDFKLAGLSVPADLQGPYDGFGRRI